jgi:hypothetical protein
MVRCDGERAGVAARLSRPVAGDEARPHRPSHHGVAILLDAFVVVLRLLGDLAWWMPGSLARRVPRIALEPTEVKA